MSILFVSPMGRTDRGSVSVRLSPSTSVAGDHDQGPVKGKDKGKGKNKGKDSARTR